MHKEKRVGARGPLMPLMVALAFGLVLYSMIDTGVTYYAWPLWNIAVSIAIYVVICAVIWRFSRVEIEYTWFGGELVIRRKSRKDSRRMVVRKNNLQGMRIRRIVIGECLRTGWPQNCCATLRGMLCDRVTLYYYDDKGQPWRLWMQPSEELCALMVRAIHSKQTALQDSIQADPEI